MIRLTCLLAAAFALIAPNAFAEEYRTGMRALEIADPSGDRDLEGFLWYPTDATGPMDVDFDSKVWVSTPVIKDAPVAEGDFPLIVLSHGMFGNAYNQAWFAGAMATRGYVVAAVNHPGTSTWQRDADQRRELWERPRDISRVIDAALTPGALPVGIDPTRVYMAGHSLGGFTAAALAGARFDRDHLDRFCDTTPDDLACGIFDDWQIARTPKDRAAMETDLSDPRIRAFALFDLGGTQAFSEESLGRIHRPILVFGAPITNSGLTLDIESRALVAALPVDTSRYIEPAAFAHFDFLGRCKPGGFELLAREEPGDEIVCANGGAPRAAKHQRVIDEVASFFEQSPDQ